MKKVINLSYSLLYTNNNVDFYEKSVVVIATFLALTSTLLLI